MNGVSVLSKAKLSSRLLKDFICSQGHFDPVAPITKMMLVHDVKAV